MVIFSALSRGMPGKEPFTINKVNMSLRTTKKKLRCFLGMTTYYRCFVPNFASIAAPVHSLTSKKLAGKVKGSEYTHTLEGSSGQSYIHSPELNKPYTPSRQTPAELAWGQHWSRRRGGCSILFIENSPQLKEGTHQLCFS